ncbi:MAG: PEGA domain-containing protein [Methanoregula sp.]|jgi:hypothetical protein
MSLKHTGTALLIVLFLLLLAIPVMAVVPPGRITVNSAPTGALACIDNAACDTTTATFTVEGNAWHSVTVTEKGYTKWTENVYVTSDQISMVSAFLDLDPDATAIQVTVMQGSGTVCLDNSDCRANVGIAGSSRSTLFKGVSPGYHTISVEASADYSDATQLVLVALGKVSDVNIELYPFIAPAAPTPAADKATGTVRVYVDRTGSTICIDNVNCYVNVGGSTGPGTGTVVFDEVTVDTAHIITVAADGYKPVSTPITVIKDMITTVDISLQPVNGGTTVPSVTPTTPATAPPTMPAGRSAPGLLPVIGALILCGTVFLLRNYRK